MKREGKPTKPEGDFLMKKTVRIIAIATALTIAIMVSCAYAIPV